MRFINKNTIKLDKVINELDKFILKFIKILERHSEYVIVSGYVAIVLGRNRATDDIDIIVPKMDKDKLKSLYKDLVNNGYWCLNSSKLDDLYGLLISKHSIRFAVKPDTSPNVELKFSKDFYDDLALKNPLIIRINNKELKASFLELQIAYKEEVLKSNKDLEDARYIRLIAKGKLDENLIRLMKKKIKKNKR